MEHLGCILRKRGEPRLIRQEYEKTVAANVVAQRSGLFTVPQVEAFDSVNGILDVSWIPGLMTLQALAIQHPEGCRELLKKVGSAAAVIHQNLQLPTRESVQICTSLDDVADNVVFCHGDFTCNNVCYNQLHKAIVILDWATAPFLSGQGNSASRYLDLVWFAFDLFYVPPVLKVPSWRASEMANEFLEGYAAQFPGFLRSRFSRTALEMSPYLKGMRNDPPPPPARTVRAILQMLKEWVCWSRWEAYVKV